MTIQDTDGQLKTVTIVGCPVGPPPVVIPPINETQPPVANETQPGGGNQTTGGGGNVTEPIVCQPGTHEENGACMADEVVNPPTNDTGPLPSDNATSSNSTG
jgi:hypothetical protein